MIYSQQGLKISKWVSNGVDVLGEMSVAPAAYNERSDRDLRLYANLL